MSEQKQEQEIVQENMENLNIKDTQYDEEQKKEDIEVQKLIDQENQEESEDECYNTVEEFYLDSVRLGDTEDVKQCIKDDVDITYFDENIKNVLHMIAGNGHMEILDIIFKAIEEQKWDQEKLNNFLNQQNCDGQTPLHFAVFCDQAKVAQYILEKGASVSIQNQIGNTAFDEAMALEKFDIAEVIAKFTKGDANDEEYQTLEDYQVPADKDDKVEDNTQNQQNQEKQ